MTAVQEQPSLVEQVLSGASRELQRLAARGILPLAPEELIPIQVRLAGVDDAEIAAEATQALRGLDLKLALAFLEQDAAAEALSFFALHVRHPLVVETVLRRRDVPRPLLIELAPDLSADLQEILLLRQDAIVDNPQILDALAGNPHLSPFSQRRIREYREHLLPRHRPARQRAIEDLSADDLDEEVVETAIAEARAQPALGEVDDSTGLTEGQIRSLAVPVRIRLSRGAARILRTILVRDPNPQVAVSVLRNNAFSDQEVEQISHNRQVVDEVLEEIAHRREWVSKYPIMNALVRNPRVPVGVAVKLVPRLGVRDLRSLSRDKNVADAVRAMAGRLYKIKSA